MLAAYAMTLSFAKKVEIDFRGYRRRRVGDPNDDNMLDVHIAVSVEEFAAQVDSVFVVMELASLLNSLRTLYGSLGASVDFVSQREHFRLHLAGDGLGHITCSGAICSDAGRNRAQFAFEFDQTELRAAISQLEKVIPTFPDRTDNQTLQATAATPRR